MCLRWSPQRSRVRGDNFHFMGWYRRASGMASFSCRQIHEYYGTKAHHCCMAVRNSLKLRSFHGGVDLALKFKTYALISLKIGMKIKSNNINGPSFGIIVYALYERGGHLKFVCTKRFGSLSPPSSLSTKIS